MHPFYLSFFQRYGHGINADVRLVSRYLSKEVRNGVATKVKFAMKNSVADMFPCWESKVRPEWSTAASPKTTLLHGFALVMMLVPLSAGPGEPDGVHSHPQRERIQEGGLLHP